MRDGYARLLLTIIAAALVLLVLLEGGWLPRRGATSASTEPSAGRYQYTPVRYGPLGNFVFRFDTATGKLERVRFPAVGVAWEEVGTLPPGHRPRPDPVAENPPAGAVLPGGGITLGPGGLLLPAPAPPQGPPGGTGTP